MISRNWIKILPSRETRWFPKGFDPAAPSDPFPGLGFLDPLFNLGEKILERVGSFEIQSQFAFTDSKNVAMRIGESGNDRPMLEIDHARCMKSSRIVI